MLVDSNREFVDSREGFSTEEETAYFAQQSIDREQSLLDWMEELWEGFPSSPVQYFRIVHTGQRGERVTIGTLPQARTIQARGRELLSIEHFPGYTPVGETLEDHCDSEARYSRK